MKFEEWLVKQRKKKGNSQEELARILGVQERTISRWENGHSFPSSDLLVKILRYFNLSKTAYEEFIRVEFD